MATDKPLLLHAFLRNITIQGDDKDEKLDAEEQYFVKLYVANKKVAKSTNSKSHSSVLKWKWDAAGHQIWFEPSSTAKTVLYRKSKLRASRFDHLVGQHEGKVVDLLGSDASFDLTDEKSTAVNAKLKIDLSPTPKSNDDIEEFMAKVDADVSRLPSSGTVLSTASTLAQVLQLTKTIMDKVSQAHPILNISWSIASSLYQAIQEADLQDKSIRELASTLRELLGTASAIPDLSVIPNMNNVIEAISRQSLQVASLIDEYTKMSRAGRTLRIQIPGGLRLRIEECQKSCAALEKDFFHRIHIDNNTQAHQTKRRLAAIVDNQLAEKILKWLSPPDSSGNRNEAHEKRQADTCSWFLNGEKFLSWRENPSFIWIHGKPGCGKSILCSSIIDELPEQTPSVGIGYFLFDGRDGQTELQLHSKLIRALVSQFSFSRRGSIPAKLVDLYTKCGSGTQQPLDDGLQNVLHDILDGFSRAYIVIDALDECTDRQKTLVWVSELVMDRKEKNLHIVVTSRPEPEIKEVFEGLDPYSLDVGQATANEDITKYLRFQMTSKSKFAKYSEDARNNIELQLTQSADGSFRWVALQLAELEKFSSADEVTNQLTELPKGLDEIYNRILKKIDEKHRADTRTFLQWLAFSQRPMTVAEIAETITVYFSASEDGPAFTPKKQYFDPQDVLVRCSSLVSESEGIVKLSHFSVKEYLISDRTEEFFRIDERTSHSRISKISIAYLLQFDSFEPPTEVALSSSPLAEYAAGYWTDHARYGGIDPALLKLILRLFTSETAAFIHWFRIHNVDGILWWRQLSKDKHEVHSPLYYASLFGLRQVAEHLLEKGAEVNTQEGEYGNALQAASVAGREDIVKLLLEKGAEVNVQGGEYGNALQAASMQGREDIVKLLLEKGADVNVQGGEYSNALQAASIRGHEDIVKLLLEKGAEVNVQGGEYGNALQAASAQGCEDIVKLLLAHGGIWQPQGDELSFISSESPISSQESDP